MVIAVVFAIPLGYLAAKRRGSTFDNGAIVLSLIGVAVPVFFLAFLLKYWFAVENHGLPGVRPRRTPRWAAPGSPASSSSTGCSPASSTARPTPCGT